MGFEIVFDRWDAGEWDALATRFASANIYQSWHYAQMHSRTMGRTVGRAALLDAGQVLVMAQFRIKRLPLAGVGVAEAEWAPLFNPETAQWEEVLRTFLAAVREEYCAKQGLAVRFSPRSTLVPELDERLRTAFKEAGLEHEPAVRPYQTVVLDVTRDLPEIRRALDQKWRNQLNVAERSGVTLVRGEGPAFFERFYKLYEEMWAAKRFPTGVRVPIIREMQRVLPAGSGMLTTVAMDGQTDVGATVCWLGGDTMLYYLGATSPRLRKDCRPGYLLQWAHICTAKERGLRWYDTGGIPDEATEIRRFKTRMNGLMTVFPGRFQARATTSMSWLYSLTEHGFRRLRRVLAGR